MAAANEFMHHLSMAVCEWFLMFLMYVDAALGFAVVKFASHCELHTPCLFCFRFDHVFGEKPEAYWSHFCNKHQGEVSCLVSCGLHHNLSNVKELCDECFIPLTKKKPGFPKPWLNKNIARAPSSTGSCSCCKRLWKPKPRSQIKLRVPKATMQPPLPLIKGRNYLKNARDKICHVDKNIHVKVDMVDALSDSGCAADLKFNSCSGSESGDSFYEIECENEGLDDDSRVIIHQVVRSISVPILEASLLNGTHKENVTSPLSFASSGSIRHDVKENEPLDLRSVNDDEVSSSSDKHEDFGSPGTHSVGEIKDDGDVEKLKRQMEHDQEELRLLHKELEEERNAAAIAADEAMAMITRLQEEKSALHMEALQYLRMMDEQAEYDMEALDKANDLITEKEKELQDLEAELEFYRSRYDDELITGDTPVDSKESSGLKSLNTFEEPKANNKNNNNNNNNNNPVLDLEDEKKHILESLSESERKLGDKQLQQNEMDKSSLENEISNLNEWLEAVESDRDFLEHACSTVQSHVGLEFIREIGQHLQDMRRIRFDSRCQTVD